jgi:4-amino-4-deoxy-L-arabinose transferase-like glycosyltransferase
VGLVGVLALVLFSVGTAEIPILGLDEGRFSQAAREMLDRGDPVVPTFVGEGRYHKPILIYWCTLASYATLGVTERAARLPANLAGALAVMLLAWTGRRRFGSGAGVLAGGALAATLVFHVQAKACTADMVLFLPTLAVMLAFERIVAGPCDWRAPLVFWIGMAVAVLAKGPIAPVWVLATALTLWAFGRRWRSWELTGMAVLVLAGAWALGPVVLAVPAVAACAHLVRSSDGRATLHRLRIGWGVLLLLALTLPWLVAVELATGGAFLREAVGTHVVARSVSAFESHRFFPGFYLVTAPLVALPWFPLVVSALGRRRPAMDMASSTFLAAWLVGPWIVMELVQTKLVHYVMPSYPAGILLVVGWVTAARAAGWSLSRFSQATLLIGGAAVAAVPAAFTAYLHLSGGLEVVGWLAGLVLIAAIVVAVGVQSRRPHRALTTVVAGTLAFEAVLFGAFMPVVTRESLAPLAGRKASELRRPGERVVVFKPRDDDLYFYLPLGARSCGGTGCLADLHQDGEAVLGLSRAREFERLRDEWRDVELEVVGRVAGLDLSRAERAEVVLFRVRQPDRGRPEAAPNIDRQRAPS